MFDKHMVDLNNFPVLLKEVDKLSK